MASIADLFVRLMADDKGLEAQVTGSAKRAGDKAGATMGQRLGAGIKTGVKAGLVGVGAVVGTAFGMGLRGVIELDDAMADFQAETGATADEVDRASDRVLEFSRRNLQPIAEIADTMAALRTQMGLTQEAAEEMTEPFLKFAEVTGQTGPDAVQAFDDVLDSWNLTADDATGLMDQLIESHQQFGGDVSENQATLAQLAPAMQAANFSIDDGISLLNLFGAKGLDAKTASSAFAKALTKVESPEELKALLADIQATEDPFERATKASDLFGSRAGAKLANALKPGAEGVDQLSGDFARFSTAIAEDADKGFENLDDIVRDFANNLGLSRKQAKDFIASIKGGASVTEALATLRGDLGLTTDTLDDYEVTQADAAGATDEAAEAFESSFGRQAQLWLANVKGIATELVQNLGPGIGGVAAAASVGGPAIAGLFGLMKQGALAIIPMLVGAIGSIGPALSLLFGPVGLIIAAIAGLFIAWQTNFLGIRDIVGNVVGWFIDNIVPAIGKAFEVIVTIVTTAVGIVIEIFKVWLSVWTTIIGAIVNVVSTAVGIIGEVIGTIVDIVSAMVGGVRGAMELFIGIFKAVGKFIGPIVDVILAPIRGILDVVGTVVGAVAGLFDFITGGSEKAQGSLNRVGDSATPTGQFDPRNAGGVRSAQTGAWSTTPGLWQLHADEMVVPPGPAQALRDWFGNGFAGAVGGRRGGDTYVVNVQGLLRARSAHDIGAGLRRLGERGQLVPPRRPMVNE